MKLIVVFLVLPCLLTVKCIKDRPTINANIPFNPQTTWGRQDRVRLTRNGRINTDNWLRNNNDNRMALGQVRINSNGLQRQPLMQDSPQNRKPLANHITLNVNHNNFPVRHNINANPSSAPTRTTALNGQVKPTVPGNRLVISNSQIVVPTIGSTNQQHKTVPLSNSPSSLGERNIQINDYVRHRAAIQHWILTHQQSRNPGRIIFDSPVLSRGQNMPNRRRQVNNRRWK